MPYASLHVTALTELRIQYFCPIRDPSQYQDFIAVFNGESSALFVRPDQFNYILYLFNGSPYPIHVFCYIEMCLQRVVMYTKSTKYVIMRNMMFMDNCISNSKTL